MRRRAKPERYPPFPCPECATTLDTSLIQETFAAWFEQRPRPASFALHCLPCDALLVEAFVCEECGIENLIDMTTSDPEDRAIIVASRCGNCREHAGLMRSISLPALASRSPFARHRRGGSGDR